MGKKERKEFPLKQTKNFKLFQAKMIQEKLVRLWILCFQSLIARTQLPVHNTRKNYIVYSHTKSCHSEESLNKEVEFHLPVVMLEKLRC